MNEEDPERDRTAPEEEAGVFQSNAVIEEDSERDRATQAQETRRVILDLPESEDDCTPARRRGSSVVSNGHFNGH